MFWEICFLKLRRSLFPPFPIVRFIEWADTRQWLRLSKEIVTKTKILRTCSKVCVRVCKRAGFYLMTTSLDLDDKNRTNENNTSLVLWHLKERILRDKHLNGSWLMLTGCCVQLGSTFASYYLIEFPAEQGNILRELVKRLANRIWWVPLLERSNTAAKSGQDWL